MQDALIPDQDHLIKLSSFEGPLDLLLYLIKKDEIDIYDIPIVTVTNQYIESINQMESLNLEVAGEFFVMASTLMYIKSRYLLPKKRSRY
jgi:segregation and condensation protein A